MSNSIIAATLLALSVGAHTYAIAPQVPAMVAQQAQPAGTTFYADMGEGLFRISGRPNQKVTFMSIAIDPQKVADINMQLADGNYIGFSGNVMQQDAYNLRIRLTSSGMADANGTLNIRYGGQQSILNLAGNGQLDGQPFVLTFRGKMK
ncbi:hypothetical protein RHP47_06420 [Thermosynechococcus sp. QKsg1]|uniref:hypothetical protein n=1 Tax=Thermosynechococcus sp. QKsg1 TaxID=3074130 RepID=UPI0028778F55|nr:hypothetical protein [Thermosynechococcus sp. QKsg1]WNC87956.1 hypothetical protein RHP47_06420 [Thermosynechococcus sp. QKsg1]